VPPQAADEVLCAIDCLREHNAWYHLAAVRKRAPPAHVARGARPRSVPSDNQRARHLRNRSTSAGGGGAQAGGSCSPCRARGRKEGGRAARTGSPSTADLHHAGRVFCTDPIGQKDRFRVSQQTGGSVSSTLWETPLAMPWRSTPGCRPGRRRTAAAAAGRADVLSPRIEVGLMQNLVAIRWRVWWWSLNMCFAAGQLAIF
jgi:hypothetical protein